MFNLLVPVSLSGLISRQFYVHSGIGNASKTYKSAACFLHWFFERFCTDSGSHLASFEPPNATLERPFGCKRAPKSPKMVPTDLHGHACFKKIVSAVPCTPKSNRRGCQDHKIEPRWSPKTSKMRQKSVQKSKFQMIKTAQQLCNRFHNCRGPRLERRERAAPHFSQQRDTSSSKY